MAYELVRMFGGLSRLTMTLLGLDGRFTQRKRVFLSFGTASMYEVLERNFHDAFSSINYMVLGI